MMKFCPKCGSILLLKKVDNNTLFSCSCGYDEIKEGSVKINEKIKEKPKIETIDKEIEVHPITDDIECPKCNNNSAYYWEVQTRASDEPATKFLKCTKCRHIWRDYK